jgi:hypothetical protein
MLGQKHAVWNRTCNLSLSKRNALTTEPRLQTGHNICRNIAVYEAEKQKKKIASQKTCWRVLLLLANSDAGFRQDSLGVINEMCLQGFNLSSSQDSVLHYEMALLLHAMNAVGVRDPHEHGFGVTDL